MQTVKQALKAGYQKGVLFEQALAFLLQYRTTPRATTGVPPSSLVPTTKFTHQTGLAETSGGSQSSE